jgi:ABC-type bacteriocin/lantibiotic exporter with double-glycine peptidase domain
LLNIKNINTAFAQRNITGETVRAGKFIEALLSTLREILIVITLIILLLVVDYKSTLIVLIILGVFSLVFQNLIKSSIIKKSTKAQYESGQANKIIFHAFGAIKTIKILNKENFFLNRFNSSINDVYNLNFWISLLSKIPKLVLEIFAVFTIVVIVIFLIYSNNYDDLNQSIGFLVLLGAATIKLFPSISAINSFSTTIRSSSVSFNFIINEFSKYKYNNEDKILNAKIVKIDEKIDFQNELYLNNITFKYPETNNLVLNEASLKIKSKNIIGILGRSGSGKSTLLDLISLLITPEKGDIRVDGKIISDVKKWQNNIGYITQDTYLLDESIKDNIAFGEEKKTLNEDRLKKAIEFSQLKDFVNSLQNGVETIIGEKGSKISGGQIQRIAIARSLYRNNGLLILDESTNSLDLITENNFLKDLKKLKEICTIIIVSHKLDTLKICDHVFEIKNGKITSSVKDK